MTNAVDPDHPLVNVVERGIKGDLRAAVNSGRWRAAVILTYAGMDAMAYVGIPQERASVEPADFIAWADRYLSLDAPVRPAGVDYYGARCGMLHTYGSFSGKSRKGESKLIFYKYRRPGPPVIFVPETTDPRTRGGYFVVSIEALADAFMAGVDRFLGDLDVDDARAATALARFNTMLHLYPADWASRQGSGEHAQ